MGAEIGWSIAGYLVCVIVLFAIDVVQYADGYGFIPEIPWVRRLAYVFAPVTLVICIVYVVGYVVGAIVLFIGMLLWSIVSGTS